MKKASLLFILLLQLFSTKVYADTTPTIVASAVPDAVVKGDQLRLMYTINTQNIKTFRPPVIQYFDVLMGPSRSQQSQTSYVNGKRTFSSSITYTYILMATKEGDFTIPPATIIANGTSITSNPVKIKVLPPDADAQDSSSSSSTNGKKNSSISGKSLFVVAALSKTNVYAQEAIELTYKVYTTLDLRGCALLKAPDFNGFRTEEIKLPRTKSFTMERYNGINYKSVLMYKYLLFPQRSGKLQLPTAEFEATIAQRVESSDPFDAFFNGMGSYAEVKKRIRTTPKSIQVKALPTNQPASFLGGVGRFTLTSTISKQKIKANEAITLTLTLAGSGNMKLIKTPVIDFPSDFELYDPKVTNQLTTSSTGMTGKKTFEYLVIPRHAGKYTIPSLAFTYFDYAQKKYKTLQTEAYTIEVEKGDDTAQVSVNYTQQEDVKVLGNDIRYIKLGDAPLRAKNDILFGSLTYILWYLLPFLLFAMALFIYRRQIKENANVVKKRTKSANKVAVKRLRKAEQLMKKNQKNDFYDEVLRAMWGYVGDKLTISTANLNKDSIEDTLRAQKIPDEIVNALLHVLNDCEFARYAPGDESEVMDKVYSAAIQLISEMENLIKR